MVTTTNKCEFCGIDIKRKKVYTHIFCSKECEGKWRGRGSGFELTQLQKEVLTGSLLGDGGISKIPSKYGNSIFYKTAKAERLDYIKWHKEVFPNFRSSIDYGISLEHTSPIAGYFPETDKYTLRTCRDPVFTNLRRLWYPPPLNKKVVPRNIHLTALTISVWFADDGCNCPKDRKACFCTNGFTVDDVEYLISELKFFGLNNVYLYITEGKPVIRVRASSYLDLINIIKPHVVWKSMNHKVSLVGYTQPKVPTSNVDGVYYVKKAIARKWGAKVGGGNISCDIGLFATEQEAAKARQLADLFLFANNVILKNIHLHRKEIREFVKKEMNLPMNRQHKLNDAKALDIFNRLNNGEKCAALAQEYGVSGVTIRDIKNKKRWKNIHK